MSRIVFFSGGSALAALAAEFAAREESPDWIITTFDSGGSTQAIRRVFDMPAVGDLRNRLLAAANPARIAPFVLEFLRTRVATGLAGSAAWANLQELVNAHAWRSAPEAGAIAADLDAFFSAVPPEFDPARASIGNLALTGAWLRTGRSISSAIARYAGLLALDARVFPVVEQSLHMGAELESGEIILGQHLIGQRSPLRIKRLFLTRAAPWGDAPACEERPQACAEALAALRSADLICFAIGSFYTSLLATLLPQGIGAAVAASGARKVYIPNIGPDPESANLDLGAQLGWLLTILRRDAPHAAPERLIDTLLIDAGRREFLNGRMGFAPGLLIVDRPLAQGADRHDPKALRESVLALACGQL